MQQVAAGSLETLGSHDMMPQLASAQKRLMNKPKRPDKTLTWTVGPG